MIFTFMRLKKIKLVPTKKDYPRTVKTLFVRLRCIPLNMKINLKNYNFINYLEKLLFNMVFKLFVLCKSHDMSLGPSTGQIFE
jgi:hypothetical protein